MMKKTLLICSLCLIIGALMAQEAQKTGFVPNRGFEINLGIFTPLQEEIGYGILLKYSFPLLHANNGVVRQALRLNSAYHNKSRTSNSFFPGNAIRDPVEIVTNYTPKQIECSIGYELQKIKKRWRWTAGIDLRYANDKGDGIRTKTTTFNNGSPNTIEVSPFTTSEIEAGSIVFGGIGYYLTPYLSVGTEWGFSLMARKSTNKFIGRATNTYAYNAFEYKFPRILHLGYHF
jgi:hypothetical protein